MERGGRTTVLLQDRRSGQVLPLRHLRSHQPHASPSLSWNGRYLALILQRGGRREAVIEDRLQGRLLPLPMGGEREPRRLSLAPDAQRLAIEQVHQGRREVEVLDLSGWLEADLPPGQPLQGGGPGGPP
ncbi:MAG: Tol biopolymer transporter periplasmic protein [Synechococcus sp.]|nr:Tol biopolymer transporter periplasmic protein [Synechococcus sp.]